MKQPCRILVNALHAKTGGGITYLQAMLPRLAARSDIELHLAIHESQLEQFPDNLPNVKRHISIFKDGFLRRLMWEQFVLPAIAWQQADVTFSPANFGPLFAPRPVVLLRNALGVADHDKRFVKQMYWKALGAVTWLSLALAPKAIAVSAYAKRHLAFGFASKVSVVHHGVDAGQFMPPESSRQDYILAVGDLTVQKNFHTLIEAVAQLPGQRLLIAGKMIDLVYARQIEDQIKRLGLNDRVILLGGVSRERLAELYGECKAFAFSSTVETFGNPLLEAMASGCPILCSNAAAMPEILGGAGLLVEAQDAKAWEQALARLFADPGLSTRLSLMALARAKDFSWDVTALQTASLLAEAKGAGSPRDKIEFAAWLWVVFMLGAYLSQFLNFLPAISAALSVS
ncbi:MAG: glycosyltransferase family 4 protein [Alphaproteobacteria bacterium]|nr:glycosyltransferase family 4 protein [Alphaproteobacteria bacterium]